MGALAKFHLPHTNQVFLWHTLRTIVLRLARGPLGSSSTVCMTSVDGGFGVIQKPRTAAYQEYMILFPELHAPHVLELGPH